MTISANACVVFGVAVLSLLGHATDSPTMATWGGLGFMSLPTAISFLLVSIALGVVSWSDKLWNR